MMLNILKGYYMKTVLVTGASRGIGQAIAEQFKSNNFTVIGTATEKKSLDYLDDCLVCDFTNELDIEKVCSQIKNIKVDILINNAGINKINSFLDIDPQDFRDIQHVNVYAPFLLSQASIPNMLEQGWGRIVNISSVWGKISKAGRASYSTSKFGIDGLTLSIANEFAAQGILANCVSPGFIDTDMTRKNLGPKGIEQMLSTVPIGRLASIEEVANLVFFLGSDKNSYISGQNIAIDGGFTRA